MSWVGDVGEKPAHVAEFLARHPLPKDATLVLDSDDRAGQRWGRHRFPTTFLVDERGVIRHINRGYGPGYDARLLAWLRAMLAAAAP